MQPLPHLVFPASRRPRSTRRFRPRSRLGAATLATVTVALTACGGGAPLGFGATPAAARANAEDFFGGLAVRFDDVQRHAKFAAARTRLARHALSPSRLVGDTVVWTTASGDAPRVLELVGRGDNGRYSFTPRAGAPAPSRPGDSRHVMRLATRGDGVYEWNTIVEHAVGRARAGDVAAVLVAALARLERSEPELRRELAASLPRTRAALGRLCTLDSVRSTALADGSRLVEMRIRIDPDRLKGTMPAFAEYVQKYVGPARYHIQLADGRGARWLDARAGRNVLTFRMRLRDGALLALDGPARPMPDVVELHVDATARFLVFDVGVENMVGQLTTVRTPRERGWTVRWRRAPKWHLPLAVRHLIGGPLDRPFAGEGMHLHLALRDLEGAQTLLVRRFDVTVQESAIVRWLGGLGFKAMDDFAGRAEVEENRFLAEALYAMRADVAQAAVPPARTD